MRGTESSGGVKIRTGKGFNPDGSMTRRDPNQPSATALRLKSISQAIMTGADRFNRFAGRVESKIFRTQSPADRKRDRFTAIGEKIMAGHDASNNAAIGEEATPTEVPVPPTPAAPFDRADHDTLPQGVTRLSDFRDKKK